MDYKLFVAKSISIDGVSEKEIYENLTTPPNANMGDYSLPCFPFAKVLRKSPVAIAEELKGTCNKGEYIEKVEVVNGYLNFFLNKQAITKEVINFTEKPFKNPALSGKVMCIDYSSVNLAKYMHIGHWATTIIGESIARIYESMGFKVVRMNYIGDYGLPFGKMVYAYINWGSKQDVEKRGIDALQELYVKFCASETEELLEKAREISKKIEDKDAEIYPIYSWFIEISKKEAERLLNRAGIKFDTWRGESYYNDKMQPVINEIKQSGLGKISEGALIVDLNEYGLGVSVIQRKDGASLYVTRDLSALQDRFETYHFDEMIYVTAIQQCNHFDKLFKLCELLNKPYAGKLYHAAYGMFSLPEGKIASRKGKQALFEDLLNRAEENVLKTISEKNFTEDKKHELTSKIAKSAVAFSILKVDRIKDKIYDAEQATSFDGETAPYIQYTYARCNSIMKKAKNLYENVVPDFNLLPFNDIFSLVKSMNNVHETVKLAFDKKEPSIIARELISIAKMFNKFYTDYKVLDEGNPEKTKAMLCFVNSVKNTLGYLMPLVCIDVIDEM